MTDFVHPGFIKSASDGDRHYIGVTALCRLYGLDPAKVIDAGDFRQMAGRIPASDDHHYYPRFRGDYEKGPQ